VRIVGSSTCYVHRDQLASILFETDGAGAIALRRRFQPYGELVPLASGGCAPDDRGFIGQRHDDDTGLIDLNARWYDPVLARFTSADDWDPIDADSASKGAPIGWLANTVGTNRYAYASDDPINKSDPNGHTFESFLADFFGAFTNDSEPLTAQASYGSSPHDMRAKNTVGSQFGSELAMNLQEEFLLETGEADAEQQLELETQKQIHIFGLFSSPRPVLDYLSGQPTIVYGGGASARSVEATTAPGKFGGSFNPPEKNAAGGSVWTTTGEITGSQVSNVVNELLYSGETSTIHVLSGVHRGAAGNWTVDEKMLKEDQGTYRPNSQVQVHDFSTMTHEDIRTLLSGPDIVIGGFCDSGACLRNVR
jgi:RHS repeat-associated protein